MKKKQDRIEENKDLVQEYTQFMDLGFHQSTEDFDVSMDQILFVYHQELLENFQYYSGLTKQIYKDEKNSLITW